MITVTFVAVFLVCSSYCSFL